MVKGAKGSSTCLHAVYDTQSMKQRGTDDTIYIMNENLNLPSDCLKLSETNNSHDTIIEINDRSSGDIKIFDAQSSVLCRRCEYFKVALSEKWAKKVDDKYILKLDVSSEAFEIILRGICSGTIIFNNPSTNILMELMLASDILLLHEFFNYLRSKLDEKRNKNKEWCDEDIVSILKISYRIPSAQNLYLFCQDIFVERPLILFESPEFLSIDEELLLHILKLDVICLPEIMIFNKLIEWGIANTPDSSQIEDLGVTIKNGMQLIRFYSMSSEERDSTLNFESILPTREVQLLTSIRMNSPVEPVIFSSRFIGLIMTWIDRKDLKEDPYGGFYNPFEIRLKFRMNDRTSFYQEHNNYYNKSSNRILPTMKCHHGPSLMIMKLKTSGKIIGAYNPIDWKGDISKKANACTTESFIFSCDDRYGTNLRLSRVRDFERAISLKKVKPSGVLLNFGEDLTFEYMYKRVSCYVKNEIYDSPILDEGRYEFESWEIYRIRRTDGDPPMVINEEIRQQAQPSIKFPIETKIIDSDFFGLIATWIDEKDPVEARYTESNMPFQFTPLFRMNDETTFYNEHQNYYNKDSDGTLPTMKCHHGPSLMIMKLKNSGKIIGAYNPLNWKKDFELGYYESTKESFIFSSDDVHGMEQIIY
ncbi:13077_t:CDS:2 [Funneliformis geosporum]|uniref:337_t:CDS:1 n=1 Tax=Funneliformis geosporum TaxID=1117311 RepID=A0A9W4SDB5_9GLOM|nr:13077_t:CDS:2 [Funneliformis geosporum]CAI2164874.1 337_t:CDS:2 [Funneliformis geosporum]